MGSNLFFSGRMKETFASLGLGCGRQMSISIRLSYNHAPTDLLAREPVYPSHFPRPRRTSNFKAYMDVGDANLQRYHRDLRFVVGVWG